MVQPQGISSSACVQSIRNFVAAVTLSVTSGADAAAEVVIESNHELSSASCAVQHALAEKSR